MKNRIWTSGKVTTLIGVGALCTGVWLYVSLNHSATEAGAVCAIGFIFLRSKDSLINIGK